MSLRVLTLNVWALPFGLARHTSERMAAIAARLVALDADVVALQEVWTPSARETLLRAGRQSGHVHVWHRPQRFGGSGLLLLSRRPLRSAEFVAYSAAGLPQRVQHADYWGGKGFVVAEIDTPTGPVVLVSTHLHAGYVEPGLTDEYVGVRTAQIVELARHLADIEAPVVLVGDLNCRDDEPEYQILLGLTGLRDAATDTGDPLPTVLAGSPYRAVGAAPQRIDYVLVRPGADRRVTVRGVDRVLDEPLAEEGAPHACSDHTGLRATLDFEAAPGTAAPAHRGAARRLGLDGASFEAAARIARARITLGRGLGTARKRGETKWATAIGAVGIAALVASPARRPDEPALAHRSTPPHAAHPAAHSAGHAAPRRDFVRSLLRAVGAVGLGAAGLGALASLFAGRLESTGYDQAERDLAELEAWLTRRDTLPAR